MLLHTINPTAVKEIFRSCVCDPNFETVSTQSGKHLHGIIGKKSVTTNWRHWNAIRIKFSLKSKKI